MDRGATPRKAQALTLVFLLSPAWFAGGVAVQYLAWAYPTKIYPVDIARGWVDQADSTSNLSAMADHLARALSVLEPYRGNPAWVFPTPTTDFGAIKENIRETIALARSVAEQEGASSFAYQQAVNNLQDNVLENLKKRLADAGSWLFFSPEALALLGIWSGLAVGVLVWVERRGGLEHLWNRKRGP